MNMKIQKNRQGKIVSIEDKQDGAPFTREFQYNCGKELASVRDNGELVELYEYNQSGFRTQDTVVSRNIINRIHKYNLDQLVQAGETTFAYDDKGRLVLKNEHGRKTHYGYSPEGHLAAVILPNGKRIDYALGPNGQRMAKYVNGELTEKYHWSGLKKLAAFESATMQSEFAYDSSGNAHRALINGSEYILECNPAGTLRRIRNHIGEVVKEFNHDAFGNMLNSVGKPRILAKYRGQFELPIGFAGGLYDKDTDLIHFGYREYIPDVGRWNRPDPLGKAGGDSDVYGYCVDDPVNVTDKSGLFLEGMFDFFKGGGADSNGIDVNATDDNSTSGPQLPTETRKPDPELRSPAVALHKEGIRYPQDIEQGMETGKKILPSMNESMKKAYKNSQASYYAKEGEDVIDPDLETKGMVIGTMLTPPLAATALGLAAANAPETIAAGTSMAYNWMKSAMKRTPKVVEKAGEKGLDLAVKTELAADKAGGIISNKVPLGKWLGRSIQKPITTLSVEGLDVASNIFDESNLPETGKGQIVYNIKGLYQNRKAIKDYIKERVDTLNSSMTTDNNSTK